jgi:hypothetical protein
MWFGLSESVLYAMFVFYMVRVVRVCSLCHVCFLYGSGCQSLFSMPCLFFTDSDNPNHIKNKHGIENRLWQPEPYKKQTGHREQTVVFVFYMVRVVRVCSLCPVCFLYGSGCQSLFSMPYLFFIWFGLSESVLYAVFVFLYGSGCQSLLHGIENRLWQPEPYTKQTRNREQTLTTRTI